MDNLLIDLEPNNEELERCKEFGRKFAGDTQQREIKRSLLNAQASFSYCPSYKRGRINTSTRLFFPLPSIVLLSPTG